jgi:hypothetical protein
MTMVKKVKRHWWQCPLCYRKTWTTGQPSPTHCDSVMVECQGPRDYPLGKPAEQAPARKRKDLEDGGRIRGQVGDLEVIVTKDGVELRYRGRRSRVQVPFGEIAKLGLQRVGVALTEREWHHPLNALRNLSHHKRVH